MRSLVLALSVLVPAASALPQSEGDVYPPMPAGHPPVAPNPDAEAHSAAEMKRYVERIPGSDVSFAMLPIPGGRFTLGSPAGEKERKPDEGPQREVQIRGGNSPNRLLKAF